MSTSLDTVRGGTRLLFDSVEGITRTVERMHESIAGTALTFTPLPASSPGAHGRIAAGVYQLIRGINGGLREGIDRTLGLLPAGIMADADQSRRRIKLMAAFNGVVGDHLEATGNPLAIPMTLLHAATALEVTPPGLQSAISDPTPHIVVLVHGLCMSELGWKRGGETCIGEKLREDLGFTPLYLRYNSGRHISTNGQQFAALLEDLYAAWPVPVQSVSLIGHSMGGLVIRSACCYAQRNDSGWLERLRRVVCLGTPHHGSPLEKAGHAFETAMRSLPHAEPMLLGKLRSVGIKDLRHGSILDEDWPDAARQEDGPRSREVVALVPGVEYYFAAASIGRHQFDPLGHLLGDLLVRADSAVGLHRDELRRLKIKAENCRVFHETNHFDLLDDQLVHQQVIDWFTR